MATTIPLTQGYVALVDESDAHRVNQLSWYLVRCGGGLLYARRDIPRSDGGVSALMLHVFIAGWRLVDHINGDGLDNRRSNLREADHWQNQQNRRKRSDSGSRFKGLSWDSRRGGRWRVRINARGRRVEIGYFEDLDEAAMAYDEAAREHHGEFATLNFPRPGEQSALRTPISS